MADRSLETFVKVSALATPFDTTKANRPRRPQLLALVQIEMRRGSGSSTLSRLGGVVPKGPPVLALNVSPRQGSSLSAGSVWPSQPGDQLPCGRWPATKIHSMLPRLKMEGTLDWGNIIAAASTSPLGIFALVILTISVIAIRFFTEAAVAVRLAIFILCLGATAVLGFAVLNTGRSPSTTSIVASLSKSGASPKLAPCEMIPDSSTRLLTSSDLSSLGKDQLRIARNEIYARHGYLFKTNDMKAYFANCGWYRPSASQVDLAPVEAANVEAIQRAEAKK
jgi:hypothetical protein